VINIGGFVPLGFFFCAYFSLAWRRERPVLATIVFGAIVSLAIAVLDSFLPTRDSIVTDIITNTLETAIAAALYDREQDAVSLSDDRLMIDFQKILPALKLTPGHI
jgi:glycopeptide antibiotics resistance protein